VLRIERKRGGEARKGIAAKRDREWTRIGNANGRELIRLRKAFGATGSEENLTQADFLRRPMGPQLWRTSRPIFPLATSDKSRLGPVRRPPEGNAPRASFHHSTRLTLACIELAEMLTACPFDALNACSGQAFHPSVLCGLGRRS
jgi:hypothetical protein